MLRNPNTIPKEDIIIEDQAMEPFFISKENQELVDLLSSKE